MNRFVRCLLIIIQVGGGFFGLCTLNTTGAIQAKMIFGILCVFGIAAGLLIVESPRKGIISSLIYQGLQIVFFSSNVITYQFFTGFRVMVGFVKGQLLFFFNFGSLYSFNMKGTDDFGFGINILALSLFYYLLSILLQKPKIKVVNVVSKV
jgi:hypothetical protein